MDPLHKRTHLLSRAHAEFRGAGSGGLQLWGLDVGMNMRCAGKRLHAVLQG